MASDRIDVRHATDSDITTTLGRADRTRGDFHVGGGLRVLGVVRGNVEPVSAEAAPSSPLIDTR